PFAWQLGRGASAGQSEVNVLQNAGFSAEVLRNDQVTIPSMENLSQYSVIYMETHSGVLPNGDAVILVDETDTTPYAALFDDKSLAQACIAGDACRHLYLGVTGAFF